MSSRIPFYFPGPHICLPILGWESWKTADMPAYKGVNSKGWYGCSLLPVRMAPSIKGNGLLRGSGDTHRHTVSLLKKKQDSPSVRGQKAASTVASSLSTTVQGLVWAQNPKLTWEWRQDVSLHPFMGQLYHFLDYKLLRLLKSSPLSYSAALTFQHHCC